MRHLLPLLLLLLTSGAGAAPGLGLVHEATPAASDELVTYGGDHLVVAGGGGTRVLAEVPGGWEQVAVSPGLVADADGQIAAAEGVVAVAAAALHVWDLGNNVTHEVATGSASRLALEHDRLAAIMGDAVVVFEAPAWSEVGRVDLQGARDLVWSGARLAVFIPGTPEVRFIEADGGGSWSLGARVPLATAGFDGMLAGSVPSTLVMRDLGLAFVIGDDPCGRPAHLATLHPEAGRFEVAAAGGGRLVLASAQTIHLAADGEAWEAPRPADSTLHVGARLVAIAGNPATVSTFALPAPGSGSEELPYVREEGAPSRPCPTSHREPVGPDEDGTPGWIWWGVAGGGALLIGGWQFLFWRRRLLGRAQVEDEYQYW